MGDTIVSLEGSALIGPKNGSNTCQVFVLLALAGLGCYNSYYLIDQALEEMNTNVFINGMVIGTSNLFAAALCSWMLARFNDTYACFAFGLLSAVCSGLGLVFANMAGVRYLFLFGGICGIACIKTSLMLLAASRSLTKNFGKVLNFLLTISYASTFLAPLIIQLPGKQATVAFFGLVALMTLPL